MATMKCRHLIGWFLTAATLLVLAEGRSANTKPASDYFPLCRRDDPKLNECIKNTITELRPKLTAGIPALRLVPLDPMYIPLMKLEEGENNFRFSITLKNLTMYGLSKYIIASTDFKIAGRDVTHNIVMKVPQLNLTAQYDMDAKILVLPVRGNGDVTFDFVDVTCSGNAVGKVVTRNGGDYVDISDLNWDLTVGGAKSHFKNLFNGDKLLGDGTNAFLNENWKESFETYKHLPQEALGVLFKDLSNQVYKRYTVDELYLV